MCAATNLYVVSRTGPPRMFISIIANANKPAIKPNARVALFINRFIFILPS